MSNIGREVRGPARDEQVQQRKQAASKINYLDSEIELVVTMAEPFRGGTRMHRNLLELACQFLIGAVTFLEPPVMLSTTIVKLEVMIEALEIAQPSPSSQILN